MSPPDGEVLLEDALLAMEAMVRVGAAVPYPEFVPPPQWKVRKAFLSMYL